MPIPRKLPFPIFDDEDDWDAEAARTAGPSAPPPARSATQLPPNHFLAQRPVTPPPQTSVIAQRYWSSRARPDTSSLAAADFDVHVQTAFLPPEVPVARLGPELGGGWDNVELLLEQAQEEVKYLDGGGVGRLSHEWRHSVKQLEIPSISALQTLPLLRRAHVALSFLGHFYIHSTFPALSTLPKGIAVPWVAVSDKLGLPPILTYADTVLWNWRLIDPSLGIRPDNVDIVTTFTSSLSERAFFLLSLLCELEASPILRNMSATLDESFFADRLALPRIASYLLQIASQIDNLGTIINGATKGSFGPGGMWEIIPACFYWEIRPWFNGGTWMYEGVKENDDDEDDDEVAVGKEMEWGGPSAGQSSLVHAVDLFLGVDHSPRDGSTAGTSVAASSSKPTNNGTSSSSSSRPIRPLPGAVAVAPSPKASLEVEKRAAPKASDSTFMLRMMLYMPGHHRSFLHHLSSLHTPSASNSRPIPSVRTLAQTHSPQLAEAYDTAILAMKRFRDLHMRLVTVFIVSQARREPGKGSVFWQGWEDKRVEMEREKERREREQEHEKELVGTGGTALVTFLKTCRERTVEAALKAQ
ncbi:Indoleamine 2,3-dioxygenase [Meredithblackwellia eburnea MCA 4105]